MSGDHRLRVDRKLCVRLQTCGRDLNVTLQSNQISCIRQKKFVTRYQRASNAQVSTIVVNILLFLWVFDKLAGRVKNISLLKYIANVFCSWRQAFSNQRFLAMEAFQD